MMTFVGRRRMADADADGRRTRAARAGLSPAARWRRGIALGILLACASLAGVSTGCWDDGTIYLNVVQYGIGENLPDGLRQGDTLQLYATEHDRSGHPVSPIGTQTFTWVSRTPEIFTIPSPGTLVSTGFGRGEVTVKGEKTERTFVVWVYPPDARIRLAPQDTAIPVGGSVHVSSTVQYGASGVLQDVTKSRVWLMVAFAQPPVLRPEPGTPFREFRALNAGQAYVLGLISLYKRPNIRDSILVTVR